MNRIEALPHGAAATAPIGKLPPVGTIGCDGKNGARCLATQMGLIPCQ